MALNPLSKILEENKLTRPNELQRHHEKMPDAKSMVNHLQELYGEHSRIARYEVTEALFRGKLQEGGNVGDHVLNMIGMLERLEELNIFLDSELEVDLILQSFPDSFGPFIMNFHMNKLHCSKSDLHNMLCTAHATMKGMNTDTTVLLASSKSKKKKRKNKKVSEVKPIGE
ncbi:uncharacterized protein LOC116010859 [Ipomoea triloba]|uniref:uncharacterized protein LOC116010859 n=1 Tax=Ipomoea triloba TaxID=35885 RepID=UPI00125CF527|nr:uncharacterized protein LOC116010859 [Ipomoea triloba]